MKIEDVKFGPWLLDVADVVEPWLPVWLGWLLIVPLIVAAAMGSAVEYVGRFLFTPKKYWRKR